MIYPTPIEVGKTRVCLKKGRESFQCPLLAT
jgi:hypothetical protein